jgi:TetR/AcrR family transcriptional repressor of uid operon
VARPLGRPRSADGAATRHAITEAAARQLATTGYDAMTMDGIALEVGITKAAIYRYFRSKRQLVRAVVVESTLWFEQYYVELAADAHTLPAQLRALIQACMQVSLQNQEPVLGYFQMGRLADRDEELAITFRERSTGIRDTVANLVDDAIDRGELPRTVDKATVVESVSGLLWAMTAGAAAATSTRTRQQLELAAELLLRRPPWETNDPIPEMPLRPRDALTDGEGPDRSA